MLTEFQRAKLPNLFNLFDMDKDGKINKRDIVRIVDACSLRRGWQCNQSDYQALYNHFITIWDEILELADKNNDSQVSLDEFLNFYGTMLQNEEQYQKMINGAGVAVLSTFDTNSDGKLSLEEYEDLYRVVGLEVSFATTIYHSLDLDQNGTISIDELVYLLDQFFQSQDKNAPGNLLFGPIA